MECGQFSAGASEIIFRGSYKTNKVSYNKLSRRFYGWDENFNEAFWWTVSESNSESQQENLLNGNISHLNFMTRNELEYCALIFSQKWFGGLMRNFIGCSWKCVWWLIINLKVSVFLLLFFISVRNVREKNVLIWAVLLLVRFYVGDKYKN